MITDPHPASQDREPIGIAATTLLEVDQSQFDEAFELLVRCHTRDLLSAHPDSPPDQIIARVKEFIQAVTHRVEQIRAKRGAHMVENDGATPSMPLPGAGAQN